MISFASRTSCSRGTWYGHVEKRHVELIGHIEAVKRTLKDPDTITEDKRTGRKYFYRQESGIVPNKILVKIVTQEGRSLAGVQFASVRSAWVCPREKKEETILWQRRLTT